MNANLPPIVKIAERLLADVVVAVSRFPHEYRRDLGSDVRQAAYRVAVPKPWGHDSDRPDEQTMFVALNLAVCNLNLVRRMLGLAELCPERGGLRGEPA